VNIAVLPGDGIGPEIIAQALAVLKKLELGLEFQTAPVGGAAYDAAGDPLQVAQRASADQAQGTAELRAEAGQQAALGVSEVDGLGAVHQRAQRAVQIEEQAPALWPHLDRRQRCAPVHARPGVTGWPLAPWCGGHRAGAIRRSASTSTTPRPIAWPSC